MVLKSRVAAKVRPRNSSVKKIIIKNYKNYYFFNDACGEMPLQSSHQCNSGTVYVSKRLQSNIAPGISSSDSVTVLSAISNISHVYTYILSRVEREINTRLAVYTPSDNVR